MGEVCGRGLLQGLGHQAPEGEPLHSSGVRQSEVREGVGWRGVTFHLLPVRSSSTEEVEEPEEEEQVVEVDDSHQDNGQQVRVEKRISSAADDGIEHSPRAVMKPQQIREQYPLRELQTTSVGRATVAVVATANRFAPEEIVLTVSEAETQQYPQGPVTASREKRRPRAVLRVAEFEPGEDSAQQGAAVQMPAVPTTADATPMKKILAQRGNAPVSPQEWASLLAARHVKGTKDASDAKDKIGKATGEVVPKALAFAQGLLDRKRDMQCSSQDDKENLQPGQASKLRKGGDGARKTDAVPVSKAGSAKVVPPKSSAETYNRPQNDLLSMKKAGKGPEGGPPPKKEATEKKLDEASAPLSPQQKKKFARDWQLLGLPNLQLSRVTVPSQAKLEGKVLVELSVTRMKTIQERVGLQAYKRSTISRNTDKPLFAHRLVVALLEWQIRAPAVSNTMLLGFGAQTVDSLLSAVHEVFGPPVVTASDSSTSTHANGWFLHSSSQQGVERMHSQTARGMCLQVQGVVAV